MSENEHSAEDRTEGATAQRLEKARDSGQLAISRDVTMLASLVGGAVGFTVFVPGLMRQLAERGADTIALLDRVRLDDRITFGTPVLGMLASAALLIGSVAVPAAGCAIGSVLLQTQFYIGSTPVRFDPSRISPAAGFARIVSTRNLLEFLKALFRLAVVGLVAGSVLVASPGRMLALTGVDLGWLIPATRDQVDAIVRPLLLVLACFAAADLFLVRFHHARSMRMTREQVRLESRESDGDPLIKAKLRRIRQQRARRRMMAKVKTADVVVTNPTHYAIALSYDRSGAGAPRVVAKGVDLVAARIREEADSHGVPIVPSPPLARALYAVELDHEIPFEHYRAVAEVIAYVWKLNARQGRSIAA